MSALKLFALAAAGLFLALVAAEPLVLPAQSTGTRHTLSHFESHPYGASTRLQYDVVVPNHVLSVDKDDNVLDVRCNADGLEIRVRNLDRAMLSYRSGQVLVGSDKWGCTADITGSQPVAFYRKVLNPPSLSEGAVFGPGSLTISIPTVSVGLSDCFSSASIRLRQTHPTMQDPQVHSPRGRQLVSGSVSNSYTFLNFNYAQSSGGAAQATYPVNSYLVLQDSYAYAMASISFDFDYPVLWGDTTFDLSATLSLGVKYIPVLEIQSGTYSTQAAVFPTDTKQWSPYGSASFTIGVVPVTLTLSGRFDLSISATLDQALKFSPGGLSTSSSWNAGMSFSSGTLTPKYSHSVSFASTPPFYQIPASGSATLKLLMQTMFTTSALSPNVMSLPILLNLIPTLKAGYSSNGCAVSCIKVTTQYRLDLEVQVQRLNVLSSPESLGGLLPYDSSFQILDWTPISSLSSQGCISIGLPLSSGGSSSASSGGTSSGSGSGSSTGSSSGSRLLTTSSQCPFNATTQTWGCEYLTLPWGSCSVACGPGVMRRVVVCVSTATQLALSLHHCAGVGPVPPTESSCAAMNSTTGLECFTASLMSGDTVAGASNSASLLNVGQLSYQFLFTPSVLWERQLSSYVPTVEEQHVFLNATKGSFRILRPVLQTTLDPYYAVQDPVWVEFETLNTDDDAMLFDTVSTSADHYYNISDCVSFGHFNYHLDLTVAGKFTEGTQALTEPFFITILLEPCFQAGAGTDFEWSLTMNSSTPLTAQVFNYKVGGISGPQYYTFEPNAAAIATYIWPEGDWQVNANDDGVAVDSILYLNILPAGTALITGVVNIAAQFPTESDFFTSNVNSIYLTGAAYWHAPMLITVYSESPQNWFTILAIDVYELVPNVPITAVVNDAGRAMYEFIAPKDVTNIVITLQTFVGDANMYVGTEPFLDKSGKYQWMSELESPIDSVTVSFLNVTFSTSLYIIVKNRAWTTGDPIVTSTYQITAQCSQSLDDGFIVKSSLEPLQYAYFVGPDSSGNSELESNLAFASTLYVSGQAPAPMSLFAGSMAMYAPSVGEGFAEVSLTDVQPGSDIAIQSNYVEGTGMSRPMLISVLAGYSGVIQSRLLTSDTPASAAGNRRVRTSTTLRHLPYLASVKERAAFEMLLNKNDPARRELSNASTTSLQLMLAGNLQWIPVATCSSGVVCHTLSGLVPGAVEYLSVPAPPRSTVFVVFTGSPGELFEVFINLGSIASPQAATDSAMATSSSLTAVNCAYGSVELFITITSANVSNAAGSVELIFVVGDVYPDECPQYSWTASSWGKCSVLCGQGVQKRDVWCQTDNGFMVDPGLCPSSSMPEFSATCDMGECVWSPGPWTDCSVPCGGGSQNRALTCRNQNGNGQALTQEYCANPPVNAQACNPDPCGDFYWLPSPWPACSKPCNGGLRSRRVICYDNVLRAPAASNRLCKDQPPPAEEQCNTLPCESNAYELSMYDLRLLGAGGSSVDDVEERGSRFYEIDASAAAIGVCIVASVQPSFTQLCSVAALTHASTCLAQLRSCLAGMAPDNSTTPSRGDIVSTSCGCYSDAQDCFAENVCSDEIRSLAQTIANDCVLAKACKGSKPTDVKFCNVQPLVTNNNVADVTLYVRTHNPYSSSNSEGAYVPTYAEPPVSATDAEWVSSPNVKGDKMMTIWKGNGYDGTADALLIGAVVGGIRVMLQLSATPLASEPVLVTGPSSKLSNTGVLTFTATDVRLGQVSFQVSLLCDRFQAPGNLLKAMAVEAGRSPNDPIVRGAETFTTSANAEALSQRGPNLLLSGVTSSSDSGQFGWNELVKPLLMLSNASLVAYELGDTSATVTLTAIPNFDPRDDEYLYVTIPEFMVASGIRISLTSASIVILATKKDCVVGEWAAWGPCDSSCMLGTQSRARPIVTSPAGGGLPCPPVSQTRGCNTCDPCSVVSCQHSGTCVNGECFCQPGWGGDSCEQPAFTNDGTLSFVTGPWSPCSITCGPDGSQVRSVMCVRVSSTGSVTVPLSACEASMTPPNVTQSCNTFPCEATIPLIAGNVTLPVPTSSLTFTAEVEAAFFSAFTAELATLIGIPQSQISVDLISGGPTSDSSNIQFTILPPSAGAEQGLSPTLAVSSLATALAAPGGVKEGTFLPQATGLSYMSVNAAGQVLSSNGTAVQPHGGHSSSLAPGWVLSIVFAMMLVVVVGGIVVYFRLRKSRLAMLTAAPPRRSEFMMKNPIRSSIRMSTNIINPVVDVEAPGQSGGHA